MPFSPTTLIQGPLLALLEYSGILWPSSIQPLGESSIRGGIGSGERNHVVNESVETGSSNGEVSIRIVGISDQENTGTGVGIPSLVVGMRREGGVGDGGISLEPMSSDHERPVGEGAQGRNGVGFFSSAGSTMSSSGSSSGNQDIEGETSLPGGNGRESSYQRYGIQQAARCFEQVLPFSLILLVVFIRQHLQGFFMAIWLAAVMFKSNGILCKQTALKVRSFLASVKALSRKEVHYGSHATVEQVIAAGGLCAICQEKMHTPILLRCKHIFCEDCASEWFERESKCPLCQALVKQVDLRSFGDGSTSLFFQIF